MGEPSRLTNDEFFHQLSLLFSSRQTKQHGSVFLSQKPLTPRPDPTDLASPSEPTPILIRATDGKSKAHRAEKIKLSTVVEPGAVERFYERYAEVCKSGMGMLRKRDRSGRKKGKAKKRGGAEKKE